MCVTTDWGVMLHSLYMTVVVSTGVFIFCLWIPLNGGWELVTILLWGDVHNKIKLV